MMKPVRILVVALCALSLIACAPKEEPLPDNTPGTTLINDVTTPEDPISEGTILRANVSTDGTEVTVTIGVYTLSLCDAIHTITEEKDGDTIYITVDQVRQLDSNNMANCDVQWPDTKTEAYILRTNIEASHTYTLIINDGDPIEFTTD